LNPPAREDGQVAEGGAQADEKKEAEVADQT